MILSKHKDRLNGRNSWRDSLGVRHIAVLDTSKDEIIFHPQKPLPSLNTSKPTSTQHSLVTRKKPVRPEYSRLMSVKSRAAKKGIEVDITEDFVKYVIEPPCVYCGANNKLSELDRKDSTEGYTPNNIVPACRRCNTIKNNVVTYEEMRFIANYLGWGYQ